MLIATHREDELLPLLHGRLMLEEGRIAAKGRRERKVGREENSQPPARDGVRSLEVERSPVRSRRPFAAEPFLFRLRNVSVYLDRKPILKNLDWEMRPGEHWALTGPNGSGKSTFLKLLLGELHPAIGGSIQRFGEPQRHTLWEIRARTGYVGPDLQTAYRDALTAREVVASGWFASIGLLDAVTRTQWRRVDEVLAQLSLSNLAREQFLHLSYGQRRRVLLARALVHRPKVLLLDEPLDGLDAESLSLMRQHLTGMGRDRMALVMITHRPEELPEMNHPTRHLVMRSPPNYFGPT